MHAKNSHREAKRLPHISAHILRHAACTRLAESGLEPKVLQYIMGDTNTQIQKKMEAVQENTMIG